MSKKVRDASSRYATPTANIITRLLKMDDLLSRYVGSNIKIECPERAIFSFQHVLRVVEDLELVQPPPPGRQQLHEHPLLRVLQPPVQVPINIFSRLFTISPRRT